MLHTVTSDRSPSRMLISRLDSLVQVAGSHIIHPEGLEIEDVIKSPFQLPYRNYYFELDTMRPLLLLLLSSFFSHYLSSQDVRGHTKVLEP